MITWSETTARLGGPPDGAFGLGRADVYLVIGHHGRVTLSRVPADIYQAAGGSLTWREAARTLIIVSSESEGRRIAEKYAAGIDTAEHPAWVH